MSKENEYLCHVKGTEEYGLVMATSINQARWKFAKENYVDYIEVTAKVWQEPDYSPDQHYQSHFMR